MRLAPVATTDSMVHARPLGSSAAARPGRPRREKPQSVSYRYTELSRLSLDEWDVAMRENSFSDYVKASLVMLVLGLCCGAPVAVSSGRITVLRLIVVVGTAVAVGLLIYGLVCWRHARTSRAGAHQRTAIKQD
jgi:hypothetical protein